MNAKFIPERLRYFREKHDFTQQQVADFLRVDRSTYSYYELGRVQPNIEVLIKLAALYHEDLESFLKPVRRRPDPTN